MALHGIDDAKGPKGDTGAVFRNPWTLSRPRWFTGCMATMLPYYEHETVYFQCLRVIGSCFAWTLELKAGEIAA